MKIDELIQELQKIKAERGNLTVRFCDNDFYPSEVEYAEYEERSPDNPFGVRLQGDYVILF